MQTCLYFIKSGKQQDWWNVITLSWDTSRGSAVRVKFHGNLSELHEAHNCLADVHNVGKAAKRSRTADNVVGKLVPSDWFAFITCLVPV